MRLGRLGRLFGLNGRRWVGAALAVALLPTFAPDTFGLACPHHLGHGEADVESHARHSEAGVPHPPVASALGSDLDELPAHGARAASMSGHGATPSHAPASEHGEGDVPPPCTCVGNCTVSGSVTAPAQPVRVSIPDATLWEILRSTTAERLTVPTPYALPWANAPPSS